MQRLVATTGFVLILAAGLACASEPSAPTTARVDRCAPVPGAEFRPEAELRTVAAGFGYQLVRIGTDAGCDVVRAVDRRGRFFDIRFEGANLSMVSRYLARAEPEVVAER